MTINPVNPFEQSSGTLNPTNPSESWSQQKINRVALKVIGTLTITGGVSLIGLGLASMITPVTALGSIPLIAFGVFCLYSASNIRDYQNPAERETMRQEALSKSFKWIFDNHGISNCITFNILTELELKNKFNEENLCNDLSTILDSYPIESLINHNLMMPEWIKNAFLLEVKNHTDRAESFLKKYDENTLSKLFKANVLENSQFTALKFFRVRLKEALEEFKINSNYAEKTFSQRTEVVVNSLQIEKNQRVQQHHQARAFQNYQNNNAALQNYLNNQDLAKLESEYDRMILDASENVYNRNQQQQFENWNHYARAYYERTKLRICEDFNEWIQSI